MSYPVTTGTLITATDWNTLHHEIETISLGTGNSAVFSSPVPTEFRHLVIRARGALSAGGDVGVRLNQVASDYESTLIDIAGDGTVSAASSTADTRIRVARWSNTPDCTLEFTIFNYNDATRQKGVLGRSGRSHPSNTALQTVSQSQGRHSTSNSITHVALVSVSGVNFASGEATLYGIP